MSNWGDEIVTHKAKKRGQIDAKVVAGNGKRKPRPWKVVGSWLFKGLEGMPRTYIAHRSADEEDCKKWIEKQSRTWWLSRQDQSERAAEKAKEEAEKRAAKYWIVGPEGRE